MSVPFEGGLVGGFGVWDGGWVGMGNKITI